jgi:transcriptional regulator
MYIPRHFDETRLDVLHDLIRSHPLAALVVAGEEGLVVNHVPLQMCASEGEQGVLRGHVARANPVWQQMRHAREAVAIFQGPEAYITPSWYPSKEVDGKAVPTWNYAVVHVHGRPRVFDDAQWLLHHLSEMTAEQESGRDMPWKVSDAPKAYTERLLQAIVGIEIPIEKIVGKWKVSQNRPNGDKLGVVAGLQARGDDRSRAMADLVMRHAANSAEE